MEPIDLYSFRNPEKHVFDTCCCQCVFQKSIYSHPWVNGKSMKEHAGFICNVFEDHPVLNHQHGECEMFTSKDHLNEH